MAAKNAVRKFRRPLAEAFGSDRYSHLALNNLDRKLAKYLDFEDGTFIEAGANDGLKQSNTYWFERFRGWRGILIEAVPDVAAACKRNRPHAKVVNAALVASEDVTSIKIAAADLMAYVPGSFSNIEAEKDHRDRAIAVQKLTGVKEIDVPAQTLARVLAQNGFGKIDLFSLDVEGFEVDVLRGMEVEHNRPGHILVETKHLEAVLAELKGHYQVLDQFSHHDYLLRSDTNPV